MLEHQEATFMVRQERSLAKALFPGNAPVPTPAPARQAIPRRGLVSAMGLILCLASMATFLDVPPAGSQGMQGSQAIDPSTVVLTVGPIRMSMVDLKQAFHSAAAADTSTLRPDAESLRRFVASHVPVLLAQAYAMQDTTLLQPGDRNSLAMYEESLYREYLRNRLLPNYIHTDEKTVRQVYENLKTQLQLAVIRVPTLVEVDTARADIARGIPFDEVARRRSRDSATARQGGTLGWFDALRFPPPQQELLWSLPVGGVSETIADPSYYSIYKVIARRDGPPMKDFESERANIALGISRSQLGVAASGIHDDLMAAYHFRVDPGAAEWLRAFLQKETATARRTMDPKYEKESVQIGEAGEKPFWTESPLKGDDARRPVAFIDGDTLPALEVIDQLVFQPTVVWPKFEHVQDINGLCDEALYERVQLREAARLGAKEDPDFIRKLTNRKGVVAWRAYRREVLLPKIRPSGLELQAMYNRTIDRFRIPERRRFVAIGGPTLEVAREAGDLLRAGLAPTTIAQRIKAESPTLLIEATPDTGMGLVPRGGAPVLDDVIFSLPKGKVSDPVPDRGGYTVLRVDQVLPPRTQSFEEVRPMLENSEIAAREQRAIQEIARQAMPMFKVAIDEAAISKMDFDLSIFGRRGRR